MADATHLLYRFEYNELLDSPGYDPYLMIAISDGSGRVLLKKTYREGGRFQSKNWQAAMYIDTTTYLWGDEIVETVVNGPTGERKFFFQHGTLKREEWRLTVWSDHSHICSVPKTE